MCVCKYGHYGHRSSAAKFQFTDHLFTEKFFCSLKLVSSRRSIMKSCMECWTESVLLEACKFVKPFIPFSNVAIYLA